MWIFDNWMIMALGAAAAWAISSVVDVCFVSNGIYKRAVDGAVISGLFCLLPAVAAIGSVELPSINLAVFLVGALSAWPTCSTFTSTSRHCLS